MEALIRHDQLLQGLDEKSVHSLNARRVCELILHLVPSTERFRKVLVSVRFWAQQRGIYSGKFGYLGGISWAILVAKICQTFPHL